MIHTQQQKGKLENLKSNLPKQEGEISPHHLQKLNENEWASKAFSSESNEKGAQS